MDEALTEEDFYCGPLRGAFSHLRRNNLLSDVQTLILDGQCAPAEILHEIICEGNYNVKILSLIKCKNLNERKLQGTLKYATRPTRPEGTPKIKGIYLFGIVLHKYFDLSDMGSPDRTRKGTRLHWNPWFRGYHLQWADSFSFSIHSVVPGSGWAPTLKQCEGIIAFDAVLCRGPRHDISRPDGHADGSQFLEYRQASTASVSLIGCVVCSSIPEGPAILNESPAEYLPLLSPPARHSSSLRSMQDPAGPGYPNSKFPLMYRCLGCVLDRHCASCARFWCENCYPGEIARKPSAWNNTMNDGQGVGMKQMPKVIIQGECSDCR